MNRIHLFFLSALLSASLTAAETVRDTTYYKDSQGKAILIIHERETAAENREAADSVPRTVYDSIYNKQLDIYQKSENRFSTAGTLLIIGGGGIVIAGAVLMLSAIPDCKDNDGDGVCENSSNAGQFIAGDLMIIGGGTALIGGIALEIRAGIIKRKRIRYEKSYKSGTASGYSLNLVPHLDLLRKNIGGSVILKF